MHEDVGKIFNEFSRGVYRPYDGVKNLYDYYPDDRNVDLRAIQLEMARECGYRVRGVE